ncbi:MAG: hypothetical protein HY423_14760 [Candidatus Lambdaproteobacteria bacterium]|nr:hypothetical protein [Candidatus Lambdaproteobacteria bacterium]
MKHGSYTEGLRELAGLALSPRHSVATRYLRLATRFQTLRWLTSRALKPKLVRGAAQRAGTAYFASLDVETALRDLRRDGLHRGLNLGGEVARAILRQCEPLTFLLDYDPARPMLGRDVMARSDSALEAHQAGLWNIHRHIPLVASIANDETLYRIADGYFGLPARLINTVIWFSIPQPVVPPEKRDLYGWHYDIDDFQFFKVFFYLTDVDGEAGPHAYLLGSQRDYSLDKKIRRRLADADVAKRFGGRVAVLTGPAGSGFIEDTFGYHKGSALTRRRAILQLEYGVLPPAPA